LEQEQEQEQEERERARARRRRRGRRKKTLQPKLPNKNGTQAVTAWCFQERLL
jgi:hypothetical protein